MKDSIVIDMKYADYDLIDGSPAVERHHIFGAADRKKSDEDGLWVPLTYDFDSRELVAADYGAPTTRKRWYAIFRRDGKPIAWPEPTHSKDGVGGRLFWKECGDYIDWSDLGHSIFDRKKPLAEATMEDYFGIRPCQGI